MATLLQRRRFRQTIQQQLDSTNGDLKALPCVRSAKTQIYNGREYMIVDWDGPGDPQNPRNWSSYRKWIGTSLVALLAGLVGACAPIDSTIFPQAAKQFGVSEVAESLSVGIFLIGFGFGALIAGPVSEVLGRSVTYLSNVLSMCIWIMAAALAPNYGAQMVFRFLAGLSGASPLVCAGGTISDMFTPLEKTYTFAFFSLGGFVGPAIGPVMSAWVPDSPYLHTWRWSEWIALLFAGVVFFLLLAFQPETFEPVLLEWKAGSLRKLTGDDSYRALHEVESVSISERLQVAMGRPFILAWHEPIIQIGTLYLTVNYIILFTFFDGYTTIFQDTYNLSTGMTYTLFVGIAVGFVTAGIYLPFVYSKTCKAARAAEAEGRKSFDPEVRLWFGMLGAPAVPISLFWMAWTAYPSISIWSPLIASVLFGHGFITIFITVYMYLIDSYQTYAASALTFITLVRYCASGGMVVVGIPFYNNMGTHWTITILACISVLLTPMPYIFYKFGQRIRMRSPYASNKKTLA
jgi:MFS family permease